MKNSIENIKTDLYRVFVKGDADTTQLGRVFILLAIPVFSTIFAFGQFPVY